MHYKDVLNFVEENDVKFIKLAFCDIFGVQKNISINSSQLESAFIQGVPFDVAPITGFMNILESDLFLFPDPCTIKLLPWRPSQGKVARLLCDIKYPDGKHFEGDVRYLLKETEERAKNMGYECYIGSECEFYLFKNDDRGLATDVPADFAGYMDIAPLDKCENVRREVCLTLEEMGINPISSHHEKGPGQNAIIFERSSPLNAADNFVTFKSVVKTIAERNGYTASFMPKPLVDNSGSGLHINLSLTNQEGNIFDNLNQTNDIKAKGFIVGVINKVKEITAFLNPTTNSYRRFGLCEAPKGVNWSYENLCPLIRIFPDRGKQSKIKLRSTDPSCNPYIAFSLLLNAGLDNIEELNEKDVLKQYDNSKKIDSSQKKFEELPLNLDEALNYAKLSKFLNKHIPQKLFQKFIEVKKSEYDFYDKAENKNSVEMKLYFFYN